jgi:hypothetical protein
MSSDLWRRWGTKVLPFPKLTSFSLEWDQMAIQRRFFQVCVAVVTVVPLNGFFLIILLRVSYGVAIGHALLDESTKLIASISDSPKPPPCRITFTLPFINAARKVAFVAGGASKAPALAQILSPWCSVEGVEGKEAATSYTSGGACGGGGASGGEGRSALLPSALVNPRDNAVLWIVDEAAMAHASWWRRE